MAKLKDVVKKQPKHFVAHNLLDELSHANKKYDEAAAEFKIAVPTALRTSDADFPALGSATAALALGAVLKAAKIVSRPVEWQQAIAVKVEVAKPAHLLTRGSVRSWKIF